MAQLSRISPSTRIPKQEVKKHRHHFLKVVAFSYSLFSEEVGAYAWVDNAPVAVLSTAHELGLEVVKIRKHPETKTINAKRAREAIGVAEKEMPIPICIDDYT